MLINVARVLKRSAPISTRNERHFDGHLVAAPLLTFIFVSLESSAAEDRCSRSRSLSRSRDGLTTSGLAEHRDPGADDRTGGMRPRAERDGGALRGPPLPLPAAHVGGETAGDQPRPRLSPGHQEAASPLLQRGHRLPHTGAAGREDNGGPQRESAE